MRDRCRRTAVRLLRLQRHQTKVLYSRARSNSKATVHNCTRLHNGYLPLATLLLSRLLRATSTRAPRHQVNSRTTLLPPQSISPCRRTSNLGASPPSALYLASLSHPPFPPLPPCQCCYPSRSLARKAAPQKPLQAGTGPVTVGHSRRLSPGGHASSAFIQ